MKFILTSSRSTCVILRFVDSAPLRSNPVIGFTFYDGISSQNCAVGRTKYAGLRSTVFRGLPVIIHARTNKWISMSQQTLFSEQPPRPRSSRQEFGALAEPHRRELQVHCYRMLGSLQDAEDLVQETMLRAWQKLDTYEGRAPFRAWLYKIATNVCLDALARRPRRVLPVQASAPHRNPEPPAPRVTEPIWLEPLPDDWLASPDQDPAARYSKHESVRLAFLAALQFLPPRQRAVLILRDVLDWQASQVAQILELTVPAVNSALHRARVTMAKHYHAGAWDQLDPEPEIQAQTLERYVRAWENTDLDELVALLAQDVQLSMPPTPSWYQGRPAALALLSSMAFGDAALGRWKMVSTRANGQPAFGMYERTDRARWLAFGISLVELSGDEIEAITVFMNPALLPYFELPPVLTVEK
jgi:RNA polymerase sigma-70 factor, ECF subfamily